MPSLFSLVARRPAASAEKDSDDDGGEDAGRIAAPLLDGVDGGGPAAPSPLRDAAPAEESFAVRVKLNGTDHTLAGVTSRTTVGELKARILALRDGAENRGGRPYLRLIHRGRMMAPDSSRGDRYGLSGGDVVHAVLAGGDGAGSTGQQARMLRRMNGGDGGGAGGGTTSRGIGIGDDGLVVRRDEEDSDGSESDFEEAEGDIELGPGQQEGSSRRRARTARRARRGFDRLRTTGMSRSEVAAIRLHFSRSVDRYAERRRLLIRESRRIAARARDGPEGGGGGDDGADRDDGNNRERTSTSGSANSLLAEDGGDDAASDAATRGGRGEDVTTDRLRMEDEWMSVQSPYSEFRMNLNTSDPLLLAAIGGGGGRGGGLFFRGGALPLTTGVDGDGPDGDGGGGVFGGHGPLSPAGTDKDYVWGFILGFFVGFIMLFWVWLPTVPHRQKLGIISGISFQLGLKLLTEGGDVVPAV